MISCWSCFSRYRVAQFWRRIREAGVQVSPHSITGTFGDYPVRFSYRHFDERVAVEMPLHIHTPLQATAQKLPDLMPPEEAEQRVLTGNQRYDDQVFLRSTTPALLQRVLTATPTVLDQIAHLPHVQIDHNVIRYTRGYVAKTSAQAWHSVLNALHQIAKAIDRSGEDLT